MYFVEQSEFQTQKEAAWAISNLTISGRKEQVRDDSFCMQIHKCEIFLIEHYVWFCKVCCLTEKSIL